MNFDQSLTDQKALDNLESAPEQAFIKIVDRTRKASTKRVGKKDNRKYTLDCERRLQAFKNEFRVQLNKKVDDAGGSFDEHYRHVLQRMAKVTVKDHKRKQNLFTEPETGLQPQSKKGTVIISEADVLTTPMLLLNESSMRQIYGDKKLEIQNLQNLAKMDNFVQNLFEKQYLNLPAAKSKSQMGSKFQGSQNEKTFTSPYSQFDGRERVYRAHRKKRPASTNRQVQNLSRVGSKILKEVQDRATSGLLQQSGEYQYMNFAQSIDVKSDENMNIPIQDNLLRNSGGFQQIQEEDLTIEEDKNTDLNTEANNAFTNFQADHDMNTDDYVDSKQILRDSNNFIKFDDNFVEYNTAQNQRPKTGSIIHNRGGPKMKIINAGILSNSIDHDANMTGPKSVKNSKSGYTQQKTTINSNYIGQDGKQTDFASQNIFDQQNVFSQGGHTLVNSQSPNSHFNYKTQQIKNRVMSTDGFRGKPPKNPRFNNNVQPISNSVSQGMLHQGQGYGQKKRLFSTKNRSKAPNWGIEARLQSAQNYSKKRNQNYSIVEKNQGFQNLASSTNNTGFYDQQSKQSNYRTQLIQSGTTGLGGQSNQDFNRLMSAASNAQLHGGIQTLQNPIQTNPYTREPSQEMILAQAGLNRDTNIRNSGSSYSFRPQNMLKQTRSGITAIDLYYDNLPMNDEAEALRYSIEFRRLVQQIQNHWKANEWPECEQKFVISVIKQLVKVARFQETSETVIDQLEDYLKFIRDFTKVENNLKNQITQRECSLIQLGQISELSSDLKKFEQQGPKIMLSLRSQTLKIIKFLKQMRSMKNSAYLQFHLQKDKDSLNGFQLSNSEYYFEMMAGTGNVLDMIRSGRVQKKMQQQSSRMKTQFKEVSTFLIQKVSVFLEDDKLLFLPKNNKDIIQSIQAAAKKDKKMYFNVLEVGMYEQMIEFLKPKSKDEEKELKEAYKFILENSRDLRNQEVGLQRAQSAKFGNPICKDLNLKDSKSRIIKQGCHRDIRSKQLFQVNEPQLNEDVFLNDRKQGEAKSIPMTNFKWKIAHMMVTSIPENIKERPEKYRYVAERLRIQSAKIAQQKQMDFLVRVDREREINDSISLKKQTLDLNTQQSQHLQMESQVLQVQPVEPEEGKQEIEQNQQEDRQQEKRQEVKQEIKTEQKYEETYETEQKSDQYQSQQQKSQASGAQNQSVQMQTQVIQEHVNEDTLSEEAKDDATVVRPRLEKTQDQQEAAFVKKESEVKDNSTAVNRGYNQSQREDEAMDTQTMYTQIRRVQTKAREQIDDQKSQGGVSSMYNQTQAPQFEKVVGKNKYQQDTSPSEFSATVYNGKQSKNVRQDDSSNLASNNDQYLKRQTISSNDATELRAPSPKIFKESKNLPKAPKPQIREDVTVKDDVTQMGVFPEKVAEPVSKQRVNFGDASDITGINAHENQSMLILDGKATLDSNQTHNSKFIRQFQKDLDGKSDNYIPSTLPKNSLKQTGVSAQHKIEHVASMNQGSSENPYSAGQPSIKATFKNPLNKIKPRSELSENECNNQKNDSDPQVPGKHNSVQSDVMNQIPLTPHSVDPKQVSPQKILSQQSIQVKDSRDQNISGPQQITSENNTSFVAREYVNGLVGNVEAKDYIESNNMPDSSSQRIQPSPLGLNTQTSHEQQVKKLNSQIKSEQGVSNSVGGHSKDITIKSNKK